MLVFINFRTKIKKFKPPSPAVKTYRPFTKVSACSVFGEESQGLTLSETLTKLFKIPEFPDQQTVQFFPNLFG